jgi:hypothetical protein
LENRKELLKTLREARDSISYAMSQLESLKRDSENPIHPTPVTSFMELKNLLDSGELKLEVGDRVRTRHRTFGEIVWTVIGVGVDAQPAEAKRPTVTLHMCHVPDDMYFPFDMPSKKYRWGHNAWDTCNLRKWLNGPFLSGFPEADREAMIRVEKTTYRNDDEGGKAYTTKDKLFLLSASELGFTGGDVKSEGTAYPFYENPENRKKTDSPSGDESCYWARSPTPWYAYSVCSVNSDGALNNYHVYGGYGAAAACAI